jgi:hypothetical protein
LTVLKGLHNWMYIPHVQWHLPRRKKIYSRKVFPDVR